MQLPTMIDIFVRYSITMFSMDINPKRSKFLKTAINLLSEKGYKAMTMRELAIKLDCDKSNIYNYINSKQELLDELLSDVSKRFHNGINDIESSSYSPFEKLKAVIALHVRLTFENPNLLSIHQNDWRHLEGNNKKDFIKRRKTYEEKITSIVTEGIDSKLFKSGDSEFLKNCILSSIRWLYTWDVANKKNLNAIEVQKDITDFILNGIGLENN